MARSRQGAAIELLDQVEIIVWRWHGAAKAGAEKELIPGVGGVPGRFLAGANRALFGVPGVLVR
jgi:hypothetical protein